MDKRSKGGVRGGEAEQVAVFCKLRVAKNTKKTRCADGKRWSMRWMGRFGSKWTVEVEVEVEHGGGAR